MTVTALRSAIARCAMQASADAPANADVRLAAFVARLSGCMESLGDHELDAMLWGLFDMPAPPLPSIASVQNPIPMPSPARVWG